MDATDPMFQQLQDSLKKNIPETTPLSKKEMGNLLRVNQLTAGNTKQFPHLEKDLMDFLSHLPLEEAEKYVHQAVTNLDYYKEFNLSEKIFWAFHGQLNPDKFQTYLNHLDIIDSEKSLNMSEIKNFFAKEIYPKLNLTSGNDYRILTQWAEWLDKKHETKDVINYYNTLLKIDPSHYFDYAAALIIDFIDDNQPQKAAELLRETSQAYQASTLEDQRPWKAFCHSTHAQLMNKSGEIDRAKLNAFLAQIQPENSQLLQNFVNAFIQI